jgi:hypothetical protein
MTEITGTAVKTIDPGQQAERLLSHSRATRVRPTTQP